ncbi:MAG: radical SAM protein [Candidatus Omnitrophica bacterium]|nr:radical SAM protein [Candidatus Omnitrophota bacterium]
MKILIVNPPFYRLQRASLIHYPPGCCYLAAVLEEAGFSSLIYNADYDPKKKTILGNTNHLNVKALTELSREYDGRLHDDNDPIWKEISDYIESYSPEVLIISVFSTTLTAGLRIAKRAKEINNKVITIFEGSTNRGLHCAIDPSLNTDWQVCDFALRKEPEETVVELIKKIESADSDFSSILGLSFRDDNGKIRHNPDRPPLDDLDKLPFPARHLLDGYRDIPPHCFQGIYGSRGCPFDCTFCGCHTSWGYKPRLRSAENMVNEIELVYRRYGTRYFYICDDIFFIEKKRALEFCERLIKKRIPVFFSAQTRVEMADEDILAAMKRAGAQHIAIGLEAGNPQIRKLIRKGNTVEDVINCAEKIKKHKLRMVAFCMVGLPWEGKKEIEDTVNLVKKVSPYIVYPYMPTPAAGTELAEIMLAKNPQGLEEYRDRCHMDPSAVLAERLKPEEKKEVIDWAMSEFVKINKKSLVFDVMRRPRFYWALAHDMGFLKHPQYLFNYLKEYI